LFPPCKTNNRATKGGSHDTENWQAVISPRFGDGGGHHVGRGWRGHPVSVAAPRIDAPLVDRVSVRVVLDASHDVFLGGGDPGDRVKVERTGLPRNNKIIHDEWGLSLYIESAKRAEQRSYMLDFGWTPEVLINNLELLQVDPSKLNGLILSHGHRYHYGDLVGFLSRRGVSRQNPTFKS
jgi:hypothetical protein